jgi:sugar/nucleoside kinase (ribokinase family)
MERKILYALEENFSGIIVITDGKNGSILSDGKIRLRAGIFKERKLIDRTGAGDAFGAGFVAGIIQNPGDYSYAIRLASANATSNIEIIGAKTGILTKEDFLKNSRWGKLKIERI